MKSFLTDDFFKCYRTVPEKVRRQAREAYKLWKVNPYHPSLHFKQVHRRDPIYSVRVSLHWRILGIRQGETMAWFWIGSHDAYDQLLRRF